MAQWIDSLCSDMIFVIPLWYHFQSHPHRFVGITTQAYFVLCIPILRWISPWLFIGVLQGIAAGIGTSNFQRAFSLWIWKFFIICFNEEDSSQLSGIIELWFLDSQLLLRFPVRCIRHLLPHIWPCIVGSLSCFPADHLHLSGGFSFNKMNLVKPVHASDNSLSPSTFQ